VFTQRHLHTPALLALFTHCFIILIIPRNYFYRITLNQFIPISRAMHFCKAVSMQYVRYYMQFYSVLCLMCVWLRNKEMPIVRDNHCYEHVTTDAILLPLLLAARHGAYFGWAGRDSVTVCGSRRKFLSAANIVPKAVIICVI